MRKLFIFLSGLLLHPVNAEVVTLEQCVESALEHSEKIAQAENSLTQSKLQTKVARANYLPNFSGNAMVAWQTPNTHYDQMAMTLSTKGLYMAGITATQPLFAGGKILAGNRLADIGVKASAEQKRLAEMQVKAEAETSYWNYVAVLSKVNMVKSYAALVDTAFSQTKAAVDAGMATRTDLLRVEARKSQNTYQMEQVQQGADLCRMALCNVMGIELETSISPVDTEISAEIPVDLDSYDLENRPEIQLLQSAISAKEQQVKLTRGDYLPTLGFQAGWSAYGNAKLDMMSQGPDGQYYPTSQRLGRNGWTFLFSLQIPLWHWGEGINKIKHAKLDIENSKLDLQSNSRAMKLQIQQAIKNVRTGQHLLSSAHTSLTQAEASLKAVQNSYNFGLSTLTALLDAQSQWHSARADLIEAQTQLRIHCVNYLLVTGKL